jgi:cAMP phosphodiesterase
MEIRVLSSSVEGSAYQFAASYLVNDTLAIDAGSIGFAELGRQRKVRSMLVSHAHLDHIASLPIFIDNVYRPGPDCPTIYASQHVIEVLQKHFFNEVVWPDVIRLSREESPFVRFVELKDGQPITIDNLLITPVSLNHVIPTLGFLVDDGTSAVAIVSDTAPTDAIWELVRRHPRMSALFLESAFPNAMTWLAEKAKHLTPAMFAQEYAKAGKPLPVVAVHIKPAFYDAVVDELRQLKLDQLVISQPNQVYRY